MYFCCKVFVFWNFLSFFFFLIMFINCSFANSGHTDKMWSIVSSNYWHSMHLPTVSDGNIFVGQYFVCNAWSCAALLFHFKFLLSDLLLLLLLLLFIRLTFSRRCQILWYSWDLKPCSLVGGSNVSEAISTYISRVGSRFFRNVRSIYKFTWRQVPEYRTLDNNISTALQR